MPKKKEKIAEPAEFLSFDFETSDINDTFFAKERISMFGKSVKTTFFYNDNRF